MFEHNITINKTRLCISFSSYDPYLFAPLFSNINRRFLSQKTMTEYYYLEIVLNKGEEIKFIGPYNRRSFLTDFICCLTAIRLSLYLLNIYFLSFSVVHRNQDT